MTVLNPTPAMHDRLYRSCDDSGEARVDSHRVDWPRT